MIQSIAVSNFKAYGASMQEFPIGRLTVLLGPNSGGKSSLSQAILALRQGWIHDDWNCRDRAFQRAFGLDLGGFSQYVHRNNTSSLVTWRLQLGGPFGEERYRTEAARLEFSVGLDQSDTSHRNRPTLQRLTLETPEGLRLEFEKLETSNDILRLKKTSPELDNFNGKVDLHVSSRRLELSNGDAAPEQMGELRRLVEEVLGAADRDLSEMGYLRSARYLLDRQGQVSETSIQAHLDNEQSLVQHLAHHPESIQEINDFLLNDPGLTTRYQLEIVYPTTVPESSLGLSDSELGAQIRDQVKQMTEEPRVQLVEQSSKRPVSFQDVGTGVISILRQLGFATRMRRGLLLIEEPGASHHPMLQASLADLYLRLSDGARGGRRFLLETHSPYIVQGLLARIRQTWNREECDPQRMMTAEDLSVVYTRPTHSGTKAKIIGISEDGHLLDRLPDEFMTKQSEMRFQ